MMDRRAFISGATLGLLAAPLPAGAQQPAKVARIGYLATGSLESPETRAILDAFRQGLRERGYVEGQNIVIEYRAAEGNFERGPGLALELARLKVDLIITGNTPIPTIAADELDSARSLLGYHSIAVNLFLVYPPVAMERARQ